MVPDTEPVPSPLSTRLAPVGQSPSWANAGVGVPRAVTDKLKKAPASVVRSWSMHVGALATVLTMKTSGHRRATLVDEFRPEQASVNLPLFRGTPDNLPLSPLGAALNCTPLGRSLQSMVPVEGGATAGLGTVFTNDRPSTVLYSDRICPRDGVVTIVKCCEVMPAELAASTTKFTFPTRRDVPLSTALPWAVTKVTPAGRALALVKTVGTGLPAAVIGNMNG
jgi:hypothetical protein